jgi:hypothetical protein
LPRVKRNPAEGTPRNGKDGAEAAFRQLRQWQTPLFSGAPIATNLTAPQRQPPLASR